MRQITEAFGKTAQLLSMRGFKNITELDELLLVSIDEDFTIKMNANGEQRNFENVDYQPFQVNVFFKQMPIGCFDPSGGAMMHPGESDYIAALDKAIQVLEVKS